MTHAIEAQDLARSFDTRGKRVMAVDGVSLQVAARELVMLMGPSGSGKTTLLAMLGCLLRPSSGRINILGRDVTRLSSRALARLRGETIGFVFQSFNLVAALKAWENVALVGDFLARPSADARPRSVEMLERLGLGHRLDHLSADLSAGEKQRVAFARALFNRPKIILADEPTANLDADNRAVIAELLRKTVAEQDVSVIVATHDERLERLADRTVRIEDGRLVPR